MNPYGLERAMLREMLGGEPELECPVCGWPVAWLPDVVTAETDPTEFCEHCADLEEDDDR